MARLSAPVRLPAALRRLPAFARAGVVGALAASAVAGCVSQLSHPGPNDLAWARQKWPDAAAGQLEHGRELYVGKCSGCHALKLPQQFPAERWPEEVNAMSERARISVPEQEAMVRYLVTMARANTNG